MRFAAFRFFIQFLPQLNIINSEHFLAIGKRMATKFYELVTTLKYLGTKWLMKKKKLISCPVNYLNEATPNWLK